jgi:peptidoglycan-associated lipoprotein
MIKKIVPALIVLATLSACSSHVSKKHEAPNYMQEFKEIVGDRVYFGLNEYDLNPAAKTTLASQAKWLNEHPSFSVLIEGHCDERGTREYNIALGAKRAEAVKNFLVDKNLDEGRISTLSYGKERPAVIGNTEDAYSKNRRSVVNIK